MVLCGMVRYVVGMKEKESRRKREKDCGIDRVADLCGAEQRSSLDIG